MRRKFYLFDTSAAKFFYLPAPTPDMQAGLAYLLAQQIAKGAFFYIPVFCIAELFNLLAGAHYRHKNVSASDYARYRSDVAKHVRNGKTFYPINITRYHNYSLDEIYPVEHSVKTEYTESGVPAPADDKVLREALRKAKKPQAHRYHLSTFDLLILAMGMDLDQIHGAGSVAILTNDRRLSEIAAACPASLGVPRTFYMRDTPLAALQAFHTS